MRAQIDVQLTVRISMEAQSCVEGDIGRRKPILVAIDPGTPQKASLRPRARVISDFQLLGRDSMGPWSAFHKDAVCATTFGR
jgi:hypothetical protein